MVFSHPKIVFEPNLTRETILKTFHENLENRQFSHFLAQRPNFKYRFRLQKGVKNQIRYRIQIRDPQNVGTYICSFFQ